MSSKQDTISKIYYDRSGFGSLNTTFKDAKAKDSSITLNDVRDFFRKMLNEKSNCVDIIVLLLMKHTGNIKQIYFLSLIWKNKSFLLGC